MNERKIGLCRDQTMATDLPNNRSAHHLHIEGKCGKIKNIMQIMNKQQPPHSPSDTEAERFDVIIVYTETRAHSATDPTYAEPAPFVARSEFAVRNDCYSHFLTRCAQQGLKAAFASSANIVGPGLFNGFWTFSTQWKRHSGSAFSKFIFDKFTPETVDHERKFRLLTSKPDIITFNKPIFIEIFNDKLQTYARFPKHTIPSVAVDIPTSENLKRAKNELDAILAEHPNRNDFKEMREYILKDRTGAGGHKILKLDFSTIDFDDLRRIHKENLKEKELMSYILQPFIDCSKGVVFGKYRGFIDVRTIILNKEIVESYIRIAKKGDFRCNVHQGGDIVYIPKESIPKDIVEKVETLLAEFEQFIDLKHTLFALDFIRSNNGNLYFIEGNSNPGIDWGTPEDEKKTRKFIERIAEEVAAIVREQSQATDR